MPYSAAPRLDDAVVPRLPAGVAPRALDTLIVVGNGMVGHRLCRRLVELGAPARYRIVVFGEEPQAAYDRVHLTDFFAGRDEEDLLLAPASWYEDHGIELRLGDPIVEIDRRSRMVRSASGAEVEYRRLVLATGSSPYVPPIEGAGLSRVFVYRTFRDLRAIQACSRRAQTAAVIGGGLLGLEAARALQRMGLRTSVLEAAASIMPAQLDQRAGKELEQQVAASGIEVRTAARTKRIEAAGRQRTLRFAGSDTLTVDMVVIAAGIRPRTELAAGCALTRCPAGGVIVDDGLRTSDPNIFAVGECASHRSQIYGLVAPGYEMAEALARHLTGASARFRGSTPATRLKLLGVDVATAGEPLDRGFAIRFGGDGIYRLLRIDRGRLAGALGVGGWPEFSRIQDATARRTRIWPWQLARFKRTGTLWRTTQDLPVTDWPPHAVVCNCLQVTRGAIAVACAQRVVTVESLVERTGASTLCGSCRPLLEQLAGAGAAPPARIRPALLVTSVAALALAVAVLMTAGVPFSTSSQEAFPLDVLWRNGTYRQITGFTLLGLSLLASLLTLRKRWPLASFGSFPAWRVVHVLIGTLTLVMLAVHTGARMGDHLNFALMTSFGTLNVLGGLAGGLTALEQKLGARAGRRYRTALVTAHILAIWPLPTLVAFHVLSVYYF